MFWKKIRQQQNNLALHFWCFLNGAIQKILAKEYMKNFMKSKITKLRDRNIFNGPTLLTYKKTYVQTVRLSHSHMQCNNPLLVLV